MNSTINNTINQYISVFMDSIVERFDLKREDLEEMWKETQKKKIKKAAKITKRKKALAPAAYILFCKDERPKIRKENPELSFADIARELGRRWKSADDEVKLFYNNKHDDLVNESKQALAQAEDQDQVAVDTTQVLLDENINNDETSDVVETTQLEDNTQVAHAITTTTAPKNKRPKAIKALEIPEEITNERQRELWVEFAKSKIAELRTQCSYNNLKTSKNRNDMILALIEHRIALEDGNIQMDSDSDEEDEEF